MTNDWRDSPSEVLAAITETRGIIDYVDRLLMDTLTHRAKLVRRIGKLKRDNGVPIRDPTREARMADRYWREGGYSGSTIDALFAVLFEASEEL